MNAIQVANVGIRQNENGLFSLNDLHKAAGGAVKHQPNFFLRNEQTRDLINEINHSSNLMNAVETKRGGSNPGTYVCRELVIAYGMWINAAFALQVIQCFLDQAEEQTNRLTPSQKQQIKAAVNERHRRTGEHWQAIYEKLHAFCRVNSYHEISPSDFEAALEFLGSAENTVTFRQPTQPINLKPLLWHALMCAQFIRKHEAAIRMFNRRLAASICDHANDGIACIRNVAAEIGEPLPAREFFDYYPWGEDSETVRRYRELSLPQYLK